MKPRAADQVVDSYSSSSMIRNELKPAFKALKRGDHKECLMMVKEVCNRHDRSGLAYRVQASVYLYIASKLDDDDSTSRSEKEAAMGNAIEWAKRAVSLSKNSFLFALLYARILYATEQYEEVVVECERELAIEDPIDPLNDTVRGEGSFWTSAEERLEHTTKEFQKLIANSKTTSEKKKKKKKSKQEEGIFSLGSTSLDGNKIDEGIAYTGESSGHDNRFL